MRHFKAAEKKSATRDAEKALPAHSTFSFSFFLGRRLYLTIAASCSAGVEREDVRNRQTLQAGRFGRVLTVSGDAEYFLQCADF